MKKSNQDSGSDDGIVAEDLSQLVEHIELTGEQPMVSDLGWEMARPTSDSSIEPVLDDDGDYEEPPCLSLEDEPASGDDDPVIDLQDFTDTELDVGRRLKDAEDEQLKLAAELAADRGRWEQRLATVQEELSDRNRQISERDSEIEELSAQLASLTLERDGLRAQLRELRGSSHVDDDDGRPRPMPGDSAIINMKERLRERACALLVAREEIDRLKAEREDLVAGLAERGEFIQQLHQKLQALRGNGKSGDLRQLVSRLFGAQPPPAPGRKSRSSEAATEPSPVPQSRREAARPAPPAERPEASADPGTRRYLIGLDLVGQVFELNRARISVGRTSENDLRILDSKVSRVHAILKVGEQHATVIDANSRNGVFVNGVQVRHAQLDDGDLVAFGTVRFRYRVGSEPAGGGYRPA